jgi:hypothetical protein
MKYLLVYGVNLSQFDFSIKQGLAKYVEWSANIREEDAKQKLKAAELEAKKSRLRIWTNYVPTNSKAIHDQNFTGKVKYTLSLFLCQAFISSLI